MLCVKHLKMNKMKIAQIFIWVRNSEGTLRNWYVGTEAALGTETWTLADVLGRASGVGAGLPSTSGGREAPGDVVSVSNTSPVSSCSFLLPLLVHILPALLGTGASPRPLLLYSRLSAPLPLT